MINFLFPFISIAGDSAAKTIDKLNFSKTRIASRQLMLLIFLAMSVVLLLLIVITRQPLPSFSYPVLGVMMLMALISFGGNVFDYLSLKVDDISLREPLSDFEPILAGLVAYALFPAERKTGFLVAFVLGTVIVYWGSHRRKLRRLQKKGMTYLLLATAFYAFMPSIYSLALQYASPVYVAFFRVTAVFILTATFFPVKHLRVFTKRKITYGFSSGLIYAGTTVANLYAIQTLGVMMTMLLLLMGPTLRYLASYFILKEKVRKGEVAASALLATIILTTIFM